MLTSLFNYLQSDMQSKKDEKLLKIIEEKEKRFQAYMHNALEAIWRIDLQPPLPLDIPQDQMVERIFNDALITEANDAMARMYGLKEGRDVIGQKLRVFMSPGIAHNVQAMSTFVRENFSVKNAITHERLNDGTTGMFINNTMPHFHDGTLVYFWGSSLEVTELIETQEMLKQSNKELAQKNLALQELISQINLDKESLKDQIMYNVEHVLLPALEKIRLNNGDTRYVDQFRADLKDLTSTFGRTLMQGKEKLTPREIEVCRLVKNGMTNKEIAKILNISLHTVEKHRRMTRQKLGLNNKRVNLQSYLASL